MINRLCNIDGYVSGDPLDLIGIDYNGERLIISCEADGEKPFLLFLKFYVFAFVMN